MKLWSAVLFAVATSVPSVARPSTRVAIVIDEYVDGARSGRSVQTALIEQLANHEGIVFIDPNQAAAVRAAAKDQPLLAADGRALIAAIDAIDADKLIIGEVQINRTDSPLKHLAVYESTARFRVLISGTGEVEGAVRQTATGRHIGALRAAEDAATRLARSAAPKLEALIVRAAQPARYELRVDLPRELDVVVTDSVTRCVRHATGADEVEAKAMSADELRIELKSDQPAAQIASSLSREEACPLFVVAYTDRVIRARYRMKGQISLAVARFYADDPGAKRQRWLARELPRAIRGNLARIEPVVSALDEPLLSRQDALRPRSGKLALLGSYAVNDGELRASVEVYSTWRKRKLVAESVTCPLHQVGKCTTTLADRLVERLTASIERNLDAIPLKKRAATRIVAQPPAGPLVMALSVNDPIYPARYGHYQKFGLADVELENRGDEAIEDLILSTELVGFGIGRTESPTPISLGPRQKITVPLRVSFDETRLRKVTHNTASIVRVAADYRVGTYRFSDQERSVGMIILGHNALTWAEPDSIAAFITPTEPSILRLVRDVRVMLREATQTDPMDLPVALFSVLAPVRYATDPANPWSPRLLDSVQFPRETLDRGEGDCDDLAVLYASLLEAAGRSALLITTPGHVFVGVETKEPVETGRVLRLHGRAWIPVETTKAGRSFGEAWNAGIRELKAAANAGAPVRQEDTVVVRSAWERFPARDLSPPSLEPVAPLAPAALKTALEAFRADRARRIARKIEKLAPTQTAEAQNRAGLLEARRERYDQAKSYFSRSLELRKTPAAENNMGNLSMIKGAAQAALKRYEAALHMKIGGERRLDVIFNVLLAYARLDRADAQARLRRARLYHEAYTLNKDRLRLFLEALDSEDASVKSGRGVRSGAIARELRAFVEQRGIRPLSTTTGAAGEVGVQTLLHWLE